MKKGRPYRQGDYPAIVIIMDFHLDWNSALALFKRVTNRRGHNCRVASTIAYERLSKTLLSFGLVSDTLKALNVFGAADQARTGPKSLEGSCATTTPQPHQLGTFCHLKRRRSSDFWTPVFYCLRSLTTRFFNISFWRRHS